MQLNFLTSFLESLAPLSLQESYDNSGLLIGEPSGEIEKVLITLDITEEVFQEAIDNGCNLIVSHHPLIFGGLKKLTGSNATERIVAQAVRNDIAVYAIHTNLDNVIDGVNGRIADRLGLLNRQILSPKKGLLRKLVTFCPDIKLEDGSYVSDKVRQALWEAGAGSIGNYDRCSFNQPGTGTFRAREGANPFIGSLGETEKQEEIRLEVIYPAHLENEIIRSLKKAHPYEEVAYDLYPLENEWVQAGSGMMGSLEKTIGEKDFLQFLKEKMEVKMLRHSPFIQRKIKTVAVCGGAGSFLLKTAIASGADAFVTGDFKYHQFFDAEGRILIADIGHYESERFTVDLLFERLREKFPTFALLKSKVVTNPIHYL